MRQSNKRQHLSIAFILAYESDTFSASGEVRIGRRWVDDIDGTMLHEAHFEQI